MGEDGSAMSDLISRPGPGSVPPGTPVRPLSTSAAIGGMIAALSTLLVCLALALIGWFLADAGAHGDTTDALRVGADAWLVGHGSHLDLTGLPIGIVPLTVTMVLVLGAFRGGRWAARHAVEVTDDRVLGGGVASFSGVYVVLAVLVCVLATKTGATPGLGRAVLGAVLISALAGGLGMAVGTERYDAWLAQVPSWAREVTVAALTGALALFAAGAVLVGVSLLLSFNEASAVLSSLDLSTGDALTYTLVMALVAPNLALLGSAYLLGPGFALGTGSVVSPTSVSLGAIPAFPVLAALPEEGPTPGWLVLLIGVPVLAAAYGVAVTKGEGPTLPFDLAAIRGAAAGLGAGILITLAISLAGGPLGTGRLTDIGAPTAEVLVFATGTMSVGGLLGGLVQAWAGRRAAKRA